MPHSTPDVQTPIQRRQEISSILGRGLLRLLGSCGNLPVSCDLVPGITDQKALDVSAPGDPHVTWLTGPRT